MDYLKDPPVITIFSMKNYNYPLISGFTKEWQFDLMDVFFTVELEPHDFYVHQTSQPWFYSKMLSLDSLSCRLVGPTNPDRGLQDLQQILNQINIFDIFIKKIFTVCYNEQNWQLFCDYFL